MTAEKTRRGLNRKERKEERHGSNQWVGNRADVGSKPCGLCAAPGENCSQAAKKFPKELNRGIRETRGKGKPAERISAYLAYSAVITLSPWFRHCQACPRPSPRLFPSLLLLLPNEGHFFGDGHVDEDADLVFDLEKLTGVY